MGGRLGAGVAVRIAILGLALLTGCEHKAPPPAPPPPKVSVVTVQAQAVPITTELPGRVAGYRYADVRPQVNGIILKRLFVEGSDVKAGQQLYQIDPAPYRASYDSAVAADASARALWERYKPLAEANAVSKQDYDNAVASHLQAQAAMETAPRSNEEDNTMTLPGNSLGPVNTVLITASLFGDPRTSVLEHRLFNTITLLSAVSNIVGAFAMMSQTNYLFLLGLNLGTGFLFLIFYFLARFQGAYDRLYWPFVLLIVGFLFVNSVRNAGSHGGAHYYFVSALVIAIILSGRLRRTTIHKEGETTVGRDGRSYEKHWTYSVPTVPNSNR